MERSEHACQTCGHIFDADDELREHMLIAHGIEADDPEDKDENSRAA
jgi:rubredoxin